MQTLSNMRRDSTLKDSLNTGILLGALCVYNCLSSMSLILPPLFAVLFLEFVSLVRNERYYAMVFFVVVMGYFEISKGFYPGGIIIIYALVYVLIYPKITIMLRNYGAFDFLYAPIIYLSYFVAHSLIMLFFQESVDIWTLTIVWYILCESVIVLVIRWIFGIR